MLSKWDGDFTALAEWWANRKSKDPSTKVGAVIVNDRNVIVGMGYNGFPRGVDDNEDRYNDRPTKYKFVAHAELNAILNSVSDVRGCTLYCTLFTCGECAKAVIQAGIKRVVAPNPELGRWQESFDVAMTMYREAGVQVDLWG